MGLVDEVDDLICDYNREPAKGLALKIARMCFEVCERKVSKRLMDVWADNTHNWLRKAGYSPIGFDCYSCYGKRTQLEKVLKEIKGR